MAKDTEMLYAGIGSRQTPLDVLDAMKYVGGHLANEGWLLRSGHAMGADQAFETGAKEQNGKLEIFLPWDGYNGGYVKDGYIVPHFQEKLLNIAAMHHPRWQYLSNGAKRLHARNVCQILGVNCDNPVTLVICWTPYASSSGGTGQAIRIAKSYDIPIFDIADPKQRTALENYVNKT